MASVRLLVIDESEKARQLIDELGRIADVTLCVDASSAVAQLAGGGFEAIVLRIKYEQFSPIARAAPHLPVVLIAESDEEPLAAAALRAGADDYIVEPVDCARLLAKIGRSIHRREYLVGLRTTEAQFRSVVEGSTQGILIHVDGIARYANRAVTEMLGLDDAERLVGKSIWEYIAPEDLARIQHYAHTRGDTQGMPTRYDVRLVRADGAVRWTDCTVSIVAWKGELTVLATVVDITDRKLAEERLRTSEAMFRLLADNIKEAFVVVELPSGLALYLSRAWEQIWGRSIDEAYADPAIWSRTIVPDDQPALESNMAQINRGEPATGVFRVIRPDGTIRYARWRQFPVRDDTGKVHRMVGLTEDITELRQVEDQLAHAMKMEAVGRLAGGVAHDFNNLLLVIDGYAQMVAEGIGPAHPMRPEVDEIRMASKRAAALTRQLLAFSRRQILQPQILDVSEVLGRVETLLHRLIGEDITLVMKLSSTGRVNADPGQLEQVLLNLAINARDAMPFGGRLTIETSDVELDGSYLRAHPEAQGGRHVVIAVSDTGVGMDEATRKRIFEPFFTTKPPGRGTGLGLATVYGIVKQSHGAIWVYSELGRGATFKVYLPAATHAASPAPGTTEKSALVAATESVLIVEDQAEVRSLIKAVLGRYGYVVLAAATGAEALALSRRHHGPIHVLLTDVILPGLSGRDTARAIVAERPETRVLYMSGYTDETIVDHGVLEPGLAFLEKPFTADGLVRKIQDVLSAPDAPLH